jgi:hypothetical protein
MIRNLRVFDYLEFEHINTSACQHVVRVPTSLLVIRCSGVGAAEFRYQIAQANLDEQIKNPAARLNIEVSADDETFIGPRHALDHSFEARSLNQALLCIHLASKITQAVHMRDSDRPGLLEVKQPNDMGIATPWVLSKAIWREVLVHKAMGLSRTSSVSMFFQTSAAKSPRPS